jgi:hypothetical protein
MPKEEDKKQQGPFPRHVRKGTGGAGGGVTN